MYLLVFLGLCQTVWQISLALQGSDAALCFVHIMLAFDKSLLQGCAVQLAVH